MNAVAGAMGEGGAGTARADFVLGDRDGTTCSAEVTHFVRDQLAAHGYSVKINDPFKGVELVRAYSNPAAERHSLQLEINKRIYMDQKTGLKIDHFTVLQRQLMAMLRAMQVHFG
jgi:N-formylglutamate amidohydrolase